MQLVPEIQSVLMANAYVSAILNIINTHTFWLFDFFESVMFYIQL